MERPTWQTLPVADALRGLVEGADLAVGLGTPAHFTRLLSRTFGVPPSSYRKAAKTAKG